MPIAPTTSWGKAHVVAACVLLGLSWIVLASRIIIRRKINGLGIDDYLMAIGQVFFTVFIQAVLSASYYGMGTPDAQLTPEYQVEGRKWLYAIQLEYAIVIVPIKCSICAALLRITLQRRYRYFLYAIMFLTLISTFIAEVALLTWCKPISANWTGEGSCANPNVITNISYFISVVGILTDWACAILPAFILWGIQLRLAVKISLILVLSLGVFASSATIAKFSFFVSLKSQIDYLAGITKLIFWATIECGVAIIAGSLPALRPLLKYVPFLSYASSKDRSSTFPPHSHQLGHISRKTSNYEAVCVGRDAYPDPGGRSDAESQKHILKETSVTVQQEEVFGQAK